MIDYLIFAFLLIAIIISGIITTRSISNISSYLGLSHFSAGILIIAVITSVPELIVGINSAAAGIPVLSLGDVLGSNIIVLSLITCIAVLISGGINFKDNPLKKEDKYLFFIALLPILLGLDQYLSQFDGLILITAFIFYLFLAFRRKGVVDDDKVSKKVFLKSSILFILGVIALLISARYLVEYASLIAFEIGIPLIIIGILLVSFGTSLPELTFETISLLHGYKLLAVGDLMGSVVINSTLVLGVVALISPIFISDFIQFQIASIFLIVLILVFSLFLRSDSISRLKALFLILIYIVFLLITESTIIAL